MNLLYLVWRNSLRKKTRFVLTVLSVVVAFFLFTTLAGIDNALNNSITNADSLRLITNHKVSMTRALPINFQQKTQMIPGVEKVTYASWFGGFFQNEKNQLAVTAIEQHNYFSIFDEYQLPATQLKNWQATRTGIIIGEEIAKKYHWQLGDIVPLSSSIWMNRDGLFTWEFTVSGIYHGKNSTTDNKKIFFQHKYFDQARVYSQNTINWLSIKVKASADIDTVAGLIDDNFANSSSPTRTINEQVFMKEQAQQFVDMAMVIKVVSSAVFFTLLLIVCNTMMQITRERLSEIAMMKALGFSSLYLSAQVYVESVLILSIGALIGSLFAHLTLSSIHHVMAEFLPGIAIAPQHYLHLLALIVSAAVICTFFPAMSIYRLFISQNLGAKA